MERSPSFVATIAAALVSLDQNIPYHLQQSDSFLDRSSNLQAERASYLALSLIPIPCGRSGHSALGDCC